MGIAGAGNSGTVLADMFAGRIAQHYGFHTAFALAVVPVLMVMLIFALCARDNPAKQVAASRADYANLLRESDTYWMCFFYSLTFGGFVGLTSYLTLLFTDQYHLSHVRAGDFTTLVVVAGSLLWPVGGLLADKMGAARTSYR
jgi:NNP family nitrate/nitrite transporter-like MFS transporter